MINTETFPVRTSSIKINREDRQRQVLDPKHIHSLAEKIASHGLIHPVLLEADTNILIAGECRTAAFVYLHEHGYYCSNISYDNWTKIPAHYCKDISQSEIYEIEFIENAQRSDLFWLDYAHSIARVHENRTEDALWTQTKTAALLGVSQSIISKAIDVSEAYAAGSKQTKAQILSSTGLTSAYNLVDRTKSRSGDSILADIFAPAKIETFDEDTPAIFIDPIFGTEVAAPTPRDDSIILNESFHEWAKTYDGPPFDFIQCDFPYGINLHSTNNQSTAKDWNDYDDSEEIYWSLIETLSTFQGKLIAPSAHVMFWFSMNKYQETLEFLYSHFTGRNVSIQGFPLMWHKSDHQGILPDPQRYGRRTYETAILLTFGDRKIVRPKSISCSFASKSPTTLHRSEKPFPMLEHFFSMFVDESTNFFDPTCGSATSLRAAKSLGAHTVLGLEIDPDMCEAALDAYHKSLFA